MPNLTIVVLAFLSIVMFILDELDPIFLCEGISLTTIAFGGLFERIVPQPRLYELRLWDSRNPLVSFFFANTAFRFNGRRSRSRR